MIQTERLVLRPMSPDDADAVVAADAVTHQPHQCRLVQLAVGNTRHHRAVVALRSTCRQQHEANDARTPAS